MRKVIILILLAVIVFSCWRDPETHIQFNIVNDASVAVTIALANMVIPSTVLQRDTTIVIQSNTTFSYFDAPNGSSFPFGIEVDSAYLIFNDSTRVLYLPRDGKPRNILDINSYKGGSAKSGSRDIDLFVFTYTITEEDYLNAKN